ncbi:MAG: type III-B CRISPR module RAMP protein Cmr4 [Ruminococcus sp.]|nr:type III-B CRISPR module RAMP protein Cmr4 [Ruminococcus sp.]
MSTTFYTIKCITNLHVGSGEVNYNIVDNEVEKDAVTGLPVIHASGIKGALRDKAVTDKLNDEVIKKVFGAPGDQGICNTGEYKFFDAILLARPMRVYGSKSTSSVLVVSIDSVNRYISMLTALGYNKSGVQPVATPDFGDNHFLTNSTEDIKVEGEATDKIPASLLTELKKLGGIFEGVFAIVDDFKDYDLPVVARNCLGDKPNLWYEEVVPHDSVFYFAVISPDKDDTKYAIPEFVQFGGNASIGCGYTQVTAI